MWWREILESENNFRNGAERKNGNGKGQIGNENH